MNAVTLLIVGLVVVGTGCTTSSRKRSVSPAIDLYSGHSTAQRLQEADREIDRRAESLERKGMSAGEARQYAEIEYLKSRAGSPLR